MHEVPCAGQTDTWFSGRAEDLDTARAGCATCPQRQDCYTGAVQRREPAGVWGGAEFPRELGRVRRRREKTNRMETVKAALTAEEIAG